MRYVIVTPFTFGWYVTVSAFALALILCVSVGKLLSPSLKSKFLTFIGYYLLFDMLFFTGYLWYYDAFSITESLPLTFCSIMQLIAAIAAITKKPFFYEMSLFFGILGPIQAFITPAVVYAGEEYILIDFFISHGLTVIVPVYMTLSMGCLPRKGCVYKALTTMQIIVAVVYFINVNLDSNYMYLLHKPPVDHPLNTGHHGHNVILWHVYFYLAAFLIYGISRLKVLLDEKTVGKIRYK